MAGAEMGSGAGAAAGWGAVAAPHKGAGLSPALGAEDCVQSAGAGALATGAAGLCGAEAGDEAAKPPGRRSTAGTSPLTTPRTADTNGQRSLERWCSCLRASSW